MSRHKQFAVTPLVLTPFVPFRGEARLVGGGGRIEKGGWSWRVEKTPLQTINIIRVELMHVHRTLIMNRPGYIV